MCDTEDKKENLVKYQREWEYYKQLAEWLEELQNLKAENTYLHDEMQAIGATMGLIEKEIRNKAICEYMNLLCDHCMQQKNECYILECPFCTDGCNIVNIAQQLKEGGTNGNSTTNT